MGTYDIRIYVDAAIRAWNPGPANSEGKLLPFSPLELNEDVVGGLSKTMQKHGWKLSKGTKQSGGAFRPTAWFRKANYVREIKLPNNT